MAFSHFDLRPPLYAFGKVLLGKIRDVPQYYHNYASDNMAVAWYSTFITDIESVWREILLTNNSGTLNYHDPYLSTYVEFNIGYNTHRQLVKNLPDSNALDAFSTTERSPVRRFTLQQWAEMVDDAVFEENENFLELETSEAEHALRNSHELTNHTSNENDEKYQTSDLVTQHKANQQADAKIGLQNNYPYNEGDTAIFVATAVGASDSDLFARDVLFADYQIPFANSIINLLFRPPLNLDKRM